MASDAAHMRHALSLAARGLGRVWPNPAVGCVIVSQGRIVGRGWTQPSGRPHAEVMALAQAGAAAKGADVFVTLEPCAHHGKTPPCAEALIAAGVTRVITPLEDPDTRVAGRGLKMLRSAGIKVSLDTTCLDEAVALNEGFLLHRTQGRPTLTLKLATTLDGRIAMPTGESRWITGPAARQRVHLLRAQHDAVLIGAGTARADDPMLDVRDIGMSDLSPVRVVADGGLSLSLTGRLARSAQQAPVWLIHNPRADRLRRDAWRDVGAKTLACAEVGGRLSAPDILKTLAQEGITRVFCEGGGQLAASLLKAGLVDRLIEMRSGKIIGARGRSAIADLGFERLADVPQFTLARSQPVGEDMLLEWVPRS